MTEEEWRKAASGEDPTAAERWAGDGPPPGPVPPLPAVRDERRYAGLPGRWAGWRGCATRPTGCRATSPSTRAG